MCKEYLQTNQTKRGNATIKMTSGHYANLSISHLELFFLLYVLFCIPMDGRISASQIWGYSLPMRGIPVEVLKGKEKQTSSCTVYHCCIGMKASAHSTCEDLPGDLFFWICCTLLRLEAAECTIVMS